MVFHMTLQSILGIVCACWVTTGIHCTSTVYSVGDFPLLFLLLLVLVLMLFVCTMNSSSKLY